MATEIERFIRIQSMSLTPSSDGEPQWKTLPNAFRVRVWHMSQADALPEEVEPHTSPKRFIFHINFLEGVTRGCRVSYLGENFTVLDVSESTRLRGLELRCGPPA